VLELLGAFGGILWGPWTFFALMGAGLLYTFTTRFSQWVALVHGSRVVLGHYDKASDAGSLSHFQALSTALSGTVGLGNIGGVALAIGIGGPGALFWMWVTGFLGMAIKSVEVTLALMYRNEDNKNDTSGGAMWVASRIGKELGGFWKPLGQGLAGFFCVTLLISAITGGNIFQAWNVSEIMQANFGIPQLYTSVTIAVVVGMVIIGGINRIGQVAGLLVPFMVIAYILGCFGVLIAFASEIPAAISLVITSAFSPNEAAGAFVGAGAYYGFEVGLKRALFSCEAGQGSAPIAHAAARTAYPAREGVVGGLEPFIDTLIICTLTAMVILVTGTWDREGLGELPDGVELVMDHVSETTTVVIGPSTAANEMPPPAPGRAWRAGDSIFAIAEHAGEPGVNTGTARMRLRGTVERASGDGEYPSAALVVNWQSSTLPDGVSEVRLVDRQIYRDLDGAPLTSVAFDRAFPGLGMVLVTLACILFAVSTMISWSYYGDQGIIYLLGPRFVLPYRLLYLSFAAIAPVAAYNRAALETIIDLGTGLMLWANLPIMLLFGFRAVRNMNGYVDQWRRGEFDTR
jgi:AGCS family alanine or glycine:cation symporter